MVDDDDIAAAKRMLRSASDHSGSVCRLSVGILLPASRGVLTAVLASLFIVVSKRQSKIAAVEVGIGVVLGLCFHPRAASIVGSILAVVGALVAHTSRIKIGEPPEAPPPSREPEPVSQPAPPPEATTVDLVL